MSDDARHSRLADWSVRALACIVGLLALGAILTACLDQFDPYWRVESYRILGMKAEPIELQPGQLSRISVLDYKPEGTEVTYDWEWCPVEPSAQDEYECPLKELAERSGDAGMASDAGPDAGGMGGGLDPSIFDLGKGPIKRFPYPGTRENVQEFCEQLQEAISGADQESQLGGRLPTRDCSRKYEIAIRVEAETDTGATEIAKKDITLWTGGESINENPTHEGIEIRVAKPEDVAKARERLEWVPAPEKDRDEQWYDLPEGTPTPILAQMPFDVRAGVGPENVQTYRAPPPEGSDREQGPEKKESITFRWFVTDGTLQQSQRIHVPGESDYRKIRRTVVNLDALPDRRCANGGVSDEGDDSRSPCDVFLWSVVRDNRDGQDWSERRLRVVGSTDGGS